MLFYSSTDRPIILIGLYNQQRTENTLETLVTTFCVRSIIVNIKHKDCFYVYVNIIIPAVSDDVAIIIYIQPWMKSYVKVSKS